MEAAAVGPRGEAIGIELCSPWSSSLHEQQLVIQQRERKMGECRSLLGGTSTLSGVSTAELMVDLLLGLNMGSNPPPSMKLTVGS